LDTELASTTAPANRDNAADWQAAGLAYHSLNFFHRKKFGTKVWKLSVEAGCDCPNRDGTLSTSGCLFCDPKSFSPSRRRGECDPSYVGIQPARKVAGKTPAPQLAHGLPSITRQLDEAIGRLGRPNGAGHFLAYFQAGTNTYGPLEGLRRAYFEAIAHPRVVGLRIATRPDCLGDEVLDTLGDLSARTWLVVEIGLQTIHDRTLAWLRRGHDYAAFLDAYRRCRARRLNLGVHVILGLPGESRDDMLATARQLAALELHSVKPHNLYAVRDTALADEVAAGRVRLLDLDQYVNCLVDFLEELPAQFVIERLGGDAPAEYLVGPEWCLNKPALRSAVEAEFRRRGSWQGRKSQLSVVSC
jgi:radical SAM protein (TIGR01212 family)